MPRRPPVEPDVDLESLLTSWLLTLRAERKAPSTLSNYERGVRQYLAHLQAHGLPPVLDRGHLAGFIAAILDGGSEAATARARQLAVRRFSAWLAEEGEIDADPLLGVKAPKLDSKVVEPLSDQELAALVKACVGKDLRERRDEAVIRLMAESGVRAGEAVALEVGDIDLNAGVAVVRRGKGGKGRSVPLGPSTARAIDRYLRVRRSHRLAGTEALWLGDRGKAWSYDALHKSLGHRAQMAGVQGFHPHRLRHTAAHRWLAAGGSEGGLMAVAGWTRPEMLLRYTKAQASQRAATEARSLGLGEW